uniref:Uncharacterized protein n=1 Tax=Anopheles coluzzii TaxID=1518534 RepID=A0A8W7PAA9_ANOCL
MSPSSNHTLRVQQVNGIDIVPFPTGNHPSGTLRLVIVVVELRLHRVNVRLEPQHLQLDPRILPLKLGDLLVQRQDVLGRDARPTVRWYAAQVGCQTVGRSGGRVGCDRNTAAARRPIVRSVLPVAGGRTRSAVIGSGATDYTRDGVTVPAGHGMCETGKQPGRGARLEEIIVRRYVLPEGRRRHEARARTGRIARRYSRRIDGGTKRARVRSTVLEAEGGCGLAKPIPSGRSGVFVYSLVFTSAGRLSLTSLVYTALLLVLLVFALVLVLPLLVLMFAL